MARRTTRKDLDDAVELPAITDAEWSEPDPDEERLEREAREEEKSILDGLEIDTKNHEYRFRIYEVVNGQQTYVEEVGVDVFPIQEYLRKKHGGGHFRVIVFRDNKIWKNKTYRVKKVEAFQMPQHMPQEKGPWSEVSEMLRQQSELIASLRNNSQQNPMEQMQQTLMMMKTFKEVMGDQQQTDPTAMMLKGVELVEKLRGDDEGGEKNIYSLLETMFKSPALTQLAQAPRAPQPIAAQPQAKPSTPRPEPEPSETVAAMPPVLTMLPEQFREQIKGQVLYWLNMAKNDRDPSLYAEVAFDTYDLTTIENVLLHPEVKQVIGFYAPEVTQNQTLAAWFDELLTALNSLLTDEKNAAQNAVNHVDEPDPAPGTAAGNADDPERSGGGSRNAENHAGPRPAGEEKPENPPTGARSDATP
jgi:hypothetical protein